MNLLRPRVDPWTFVAVLTLVSIGVIMVGASSAVLAEATHGDAAYFLKRQLVFAMAGGVAMLMAASVEPAALARHSLPLLAAAMFLLVIVLIPGIGHVAGGSRRWLQLGPVGLQAGEVIKLAIVVQLASSLARKQPSMMVDPRHRGERPVARIALLPHLVAPGLAMVLLLGQPDFGTAVLLAVMTLLLLFVGGARVGTLAAVLALAIPLAVFVVSSSAYRMRRVLAFLDPWAHRYDIGYQITESLMTIGSGGFFGLGLGESRQKLFFLPAAHTDFIFSVLGEELGFLGVALVIACFGVIAVRSFQAAARAQSAFSALLIIGLGSMLVLQATFNIAVALGLVPTKGITLPFVSYGGSSLVMSMVCAGFLLRAVGDALPSSAAEPRRSGSVGAPRTSFLPEGT